MTMTWRSGSGPAQSGFTSPWSANGIWQSIHVGVGETLERVFVETALYTRTTMLDPMSSPFDPAWFAGFGIFHMALSYTQGSGVPTDPLIPQGTEGGGGEFLWRAKLMPFHQATFDTPNGISQVIRWAPEPGTQMQGKGRRGPNALDETWLGFSWFVDDIYGRFADDTVTFYSIMTGTIGCHALFSSVP